MHQKLVLCDGVGVYIYRNAPVMRVAAVWYKVVGGSETAEAPKCYDYALYGAVTSSVCMTERVADRDFRCI